MTAIDAMQVPRAMAWHTRIRLILVMVLWAACFPLIALGLESVPHLAFAALRATAAGACLLAFGLLLGRRLPADWSVWGLLGATGLGATTLGFLGMFHGAEFISPGMATVIANVQPMLAAVLAYSVLGERLGWKGAAGLSVGLAGIVMLAWPAMSVSGSYRTGMAYIFLSAVGVTIGNVAMKRLSGRVDALMAMGVQLLLGGVPLALFSVLAEDPSSIAWTPRFLFALLALVVLVTATGYWLWFRSLAETTLNQANALTFLVPVFGLAAGVLFFDEPLGWTAIVGGALVVAGIILVQGEDGRHASSPPGSPQS